MKGLSRWKEHVEALHADGYHDNVLSVSIAAVEQLDAEVRRLRSALEEIVRVTDREHREAFIAQGPRAAMGLVNIARSALGKEAGKP